MQEQTNFKNIRAVAKKELKSFFDYPFAYILLIIFTGLSFYFYLNGIFLIKEASLRGYFQIIPWFLLFYIPAITMRALAQEKKEGTYELMITQPISELDYLLGKYLGNFIFVAVTFLASITLPITLFVIGQPDVGVIVGQYLGVLLFAASVTAIGIWISSTTKNQTIAFLVSVLIIALLIVSGLEIVTVSAPYPLNQLMVEISILHHFDSIARGVINIKDILYFFALIIISLSMSYLTFIRQKFGQHSNYYGKTKLRSLTVIALAVILIFSGRYISLRFDLTQNQLYTLSGGSKEVLRSIPKTLTVELYLSKELPSEAQLISRDAKDLLKDYENASNGKVKLVLRDPDGRPKDMEEARKRGLRPVQFNVLRQNEYQVKQAYFVMLFKYEDKTQVLPLEGDTRDLEYRISQIIDKMTATKKPEIWFLSGHGEKVMDEDYKDILPDITDRYDVRTKNFASEDAVIPASIDAIIIPGTKTDMSAATLLAIQSYLQSGGKAFFLVDTVNIVPQLVMGVTQTNNLIALLKQYGVTVGNDLATDLQANEVVNFTLNNNNLAVNYPFWVRASAAGDLIVNKGVNGLLLPWASSVTVDPTLLKGAKATVIYETSNKGNTQIAQFSNQNNNLAGAAGMGQFNINPVENPTFNSQNLRNVPLAVVIDGSVPGSENTAIKGRIIVIGDSDFATGQYLSNAPSNFIFFMNSIDWLAQDDKLISIRSKNSAPRPIASLTNSEKNVIKYTNLVGVPLIIAMFGLLRYKRRQQKIHWEMEIEETQDPSPAQDPEQDEDAKN